MKTVEVPDDKFLEENVPPSMINVLRTLRECLAIAPGPTWSALTGSAVLKKKEVEGLLQHPSIVVGIDEGESVLSPFGLLAGCVNTERLRLAMDIEEDQCEIVRFYIVKVVP